MKPIPRDPERWEGLQWYADFCHIEGKKIDDPSALAALADAVKRKVEEILGDAERVPGIAHETMFENIVVELGGAKFIKREDAGAVRSTEAVQPPDFRITLADDRCILVELKTTRSRSEAGKGVKIAKKEFKRLLEYAKLAGGELWFGTFWDGLDAWTLNHHSDFRIKGKNYLLDMFPAMKTNAMADLGDVMVGTKPPLHVRIVTDPAHPRELDDQGFGQYTISRLDLFCDGNLVEDDLGRNLAFFLFLFGRWEMSGPRLDLDVDGRTILAVDWEAVPEEPVPDQEMQIVGAMSSLYARMFKALTTDDNGRYVRLRLAPSPGRLRKLAPNDFPFGRSGMRLWILQLQPNHAPTESS